MACENSFVCKSILQCAETCANQGHSATNSFYYEFHAHTISALLYCSYSLLFIVIEYTIKPDKQYSYFLFSINLLKLSVFYLCCFK